MLSRPLHAGRHHLKAVLGNPHTTEEQLQTIASLLAQSLADLPDAADLGAPTLTPLSA